MCPWCADDLHNRVGLWLCYGVVLGAWPIVLTKRDTSVNERDPHPQASLSKPENGWEGKAVLE